ncbi:hypothetical protein ACPCSP_20975 [Streptomyces cinereoruber]|uniref:hypothetical protein n=1 Tax=Streptomyces cinereoruber TaxID=67260 RepID=UPI003C2EA4CF
MSVVAVWANGIVQDTDRYVATVGPLASDPDVQEAVTDRVTDVVLAQVGVGALVKQLTDAAAEQGVPPRSAALISDLDGPISDGLERLVRDAVGEVVTSSAFETVRADANRRARSALDKALTDRSDTVVELKDDEVVIDLGPVVAQVKDRMVEAGSSPTAKIPAVHTDFVVFASEDVGRGQDLRAGAGDPRRPAARHHVAGRGGRGVPGVPPAVHGRRSRAGRVLAMVVLGIGLTVFRDVYLDHLPPGASRAATGTVYDVLVRFLRAGVRTLAAVALFTAVGAFLCGPSRIAVLTRTACRRGIGALRDAAASAGLRLGAVGRFVHRFKHWIGVFILVTAAVVLFTWSYPTTVVVVWTVAIVLVALAIREFLDDGPAPPPTSGRPPLAH